MSQILFIVWTEKNNLGIPIIDEQHRGIISTINSLYHSIQMGDYEDTVKPLLVALEHYTKIHFRTEKDLMLKAEYPNFNNHIALHNKLFEKTKTFSANANVLPDATEVLRFLKKWWLTHINKEDRHFSFWV